VDVYRICSPFFPMILNFLDDVFTQSGRGTVNSVRCASRDMGSGSGGGEASFSSEISVHC
jgi:hypothetical protein